MPTVKDDYYFEPPYGCDLDPQDPDWIDPDDPRCLPPVLDHFKCYEATGSSVETQVTLLDQFEIDINFVVLRPLRFCNPVVKIHGDRTEIANPTQHLVCYDVARPVHTENQFDAEDFLVRKNMDLCVPSEKIIDQDQE